MLRRLRLLTALVVFASASGAGSMTGSDLLPDKIGGWTPSGQDSVYNAETIYDYMDGAAELYLSYSFDRLFVRTLEKPGSPTITIELFSMKSSQDAFGVFSLQREGKHIGIGTESEYERGLLRFWKGTYFANIYTERETPEAKKALLHAGTHVSDAINSRGKKPRLLDVLPETGLDEQTIRYFHNHVCLNYCYFVASENILNLDDQTEAVLATYNNPDGASRILLIRYANKESADEALQQFGQSYMPDAAGSNMVRTENGTWTALMRYESVVAVIFDAPSEEYAHMQTVGIQAIYKELESDEQ